MKHLITFLFLMATAAFSAVGQISSKTAELGWLELPAFSEDHEHFFVSHYTDEYWGKQRNYSLFWDQNRQIPIWVAYPLNERLIGHEALDAMLLTNYSGMPRHFLFTPKFSQRGITEIGHQGVPVARQFDLDGSISAARHRLRLS